MKRFSIITPCFNAEKYIAETVESVLTQTAVLSGRAELEYIICDGKSTDRTIELIRQVAETRKVSLRILSETDSGIYDALSKGLMMATGDVCAYLNAGDFFNEHAFDIVLDVLESVRAYWITGMSCICNEKNQITGAFSPPRYRSRLIRTGFYGRVLPVIQQESTFWKADLNGLIDFSMLPRFKYAGDHYIWYCFSKVVELKAVEAFLGCFKIHAGQLSENMAGYRAELASIAEEPGLTDHVLAFYDRVMRNAPHKVKGMLGWNNSILYNHRSQHWQDSER